MYKSIKKRYFLSGILSIFLLNGCSVEDISEIPPENMVSVRIEINRENLTYTKAPGDEALSVNRLLLLPFKKSNESVTDDAVNFLPDYSAAKQININTFPVVATMLKLSAASTYQVMIIGYNRNDFDFANQNNVNRRFSIGSTGSPATMANLYLQPTIVANVPEFFTCIGNAYQKNGTLVGRYFKPDNISYIQGNMKRVISGLTLAINNIPNFVSSISLVAENLVKATSIIDGTPLIVQSKDDGESRLLDKQIPISNVITFNRYMLATSDAYKSLYYLDVSYGMFTSRYTLKIADRPNVVSNNRIIFTPNQWVKIIGDYKDINLGFQINGNINLDDDMWDGMQ